MRLDHTGVTTGVVILFDNVVAAGPIAAVFRNDDGSGGQYLANGEILDIGEIRVSESFDLPVKRTPRISYGTVNKQRFTSSGAQNLVIRPQVRTLQIELAPLAQAEAINGGTNDLGIVLRQIMQGNVAIFVPFPVVDRAYYPAELHNPDRSEKIRAKTSMLASFNQAPNMSMDGNFYWLTSMNVTESI